jgi:GMP synthase (glutamine-hydrolysing)
MADKFLVIEQAAHEDPALFGELLTRSGFEPVYARMHAGNQVPDDPARFAGILVMGGPMNVEDADHIPWLNDELKLIAAAAESGVPVLGICLGSQLIARALGGAVYSGGKPEIGWYTVDLTAEAEIDMLLEGFPKQLEVFQWHGQTFDIPPGAVRLAGSAMFPNQAFRAGENVWGIQFHMEVTADTVNKWLEINSHEVAIHGIDADAVKTSAAGKLERITPLAQKLFGRFLELCRSGNAGA